MDSVQLFKRLQQHRHWVNRNLLEVASSLTSEQLRQTFAIGQGTIWRTLCHLYAAEYVWLGALLGDEEPLVPGDVRGKLPGNQEGTGGLVDIADLQQKWELLDQRWADYLNTVTPDDLDQLCYKTSTSSGAGIRFATRKSDILLHISTHAQYTTAQVLNMFRQSGVQKFPDVMLVSLARKETGLI